MARAAEPERSALGTTIQRLDAERGKMNRVTYEMFKVHPTLDLIHGLAQAHLASHDRLLKELSEIVADLLAFQQTGELRRDIDLEPLHLQNVW